MKTKFAAWMCAFLLVPTSYLIAAEPTPPAGFRALFNGRDLTGWYGLNPHSVAKFEGEKRDVALKKMRDEFAQHWRVENGELVNVGTGPYATTDAEFGDIELLIDYKTVPHADSGIYLRGTPQVQIWDINQPSLPSKPDRNPNLGSGGLFNNTPKSPGRDPLVQADKPFGEWNSFRIKQIGDRTWVWLNDKAVVDNAVMQNYWDRGKPLPAKGPIMLQTHGGEIRWRNIFVREITAADAKPNQPDQSNKADRQVQPGVPQGKVTPGVFEESRIFPGTRRDYSVYVPAQYNADQPPALMVFMDGSGYAKTDAAFRVPVVFDNLIHQKAMPVTIAVFVNPGNIPAKKPGAKDRSNRSFEYDSMSDRYARFLVEEFLPVALKGLNVSSDPKQRAVCGISSGGICAFTAAWEKPDQFGKVLSHIGSFTNIRGGWAYPGLVRKTKSNPKAIKIYLQDGENDLNNLFGNWPLANSDLAAALRFAGYEHKFVMTPGGHSSQYGGELLPQALRWLWSEQSTPAQQAAAKTTPEWKPHPDAVPRNDVPHGKVEVLGEWKSQIFENTVREWAIYVPAQYKADQPAALMVFQDGHNYRNVEGRWRVPVVFDNLIARGDMPPTIAVFINPGHDPSKGSPADRYKASNRSFEYDSLGDRYARFLLEEIIPEVEKRFTISKDPEMRAICGASSGGICSFTVAWERPDAFRKVLSTIGSFTNLRGGNVYPSLVRKTEPKPLRVFLADTSGDVDNAFGSWPWSNQLMASSLQYMGYDVRFDWAEGYAHNSDHGGALFPEAVKWLWRKDKPEPKIDTKGDLGGDMTLLKLLIPGEGWTPVAENLGFADAPCADSDANFYFSDMKAPAVYQVSAVDGMRKEIAKEAVSGLELGPDGLLYGCQGAKNRVISIDPKSGEVKEVAAGVTPNDLAITTDGIIYITETKSTRVTRVNPKTGETMPVDEGIAKPNGIALSNDGGTLAVSDSGGEHVWTFRVNADGALDAKMPTMTMRLPIDPKGEFKHNEPPPYQSASRGDGMAVDKLGRYYVTSAVGVQVFDPTGRQCGVLPKPIESQPLTSCTLAGPGHSYLYITNGTTIFRRKVKVDK